MHNFGMDASMLSLLIAVIIAGVLVFIMISFNQKRTHKFDTEEYQYLWLKIENMLDKNNPLSFNAVAIESDKLLDKAICEMGINGKTMGERLKKIGNKFSAINSVWYAHKLRNQIAHEPNFQLKYEQAKNVLKTFKQALKDLGAI